MKAEREGGAQALRPLWRSVVDLCHPFLMGTRQTWIGRELTSSRPVAPAPPSLPAAVVFGYPCYLILLGLIKGEDQYKT